MAKVGNFWGIKKATFLGVAFSIVFYIFFQDFDASYQQNAHIYEENAPFYQQKAHPNQQIAHIYKENAPFYQQKAPS